MRDLPTFLATQSGISQKAYGPQRSAGAAVMDASAALRAANDAPLDLYAWIDLILAGIEGALRSGNTPFAVAQALANRQAEQVARKWPPTLAHAVAPQLATPEPTLDQYGPAAPTETAHEQSEQPLPA
jgi:hypothetical protein